MINETQVNQVLNKISSLRRSRANWLPIATEVVRFLENDAIKPAAVPNFLNLASHAAGCEVNTFRRQVRIAKFVITHGSEIIDQKHQQAVADLPFSAMEMCVRLYGISPMKAKEEMSKLLSGKNKFVEIRAVYEAELGAMSASNVSSRSSSLARIHEFEDEAINIIQSHTEVLYPSTDAQNAHLEMTRRVRLDLARPDFVVVGGSLKAPAWIDAIEVKLLSVDNARSTKLPLLERAVFLSLLFRRVWFALPIDVSETTRRRVIEPLAQALTDMNIRTAGIFLVGKTLGRDDIEIVRTPEAPDGDEPPIQARLRQQIATSSPNERSIRNSLG